MVVGTSDSRQSTNQNKQIKSLSTHDVILIQRLESNANHRKDLKEKRNSQFHWWKTSAKYWDPSVYRFCEPCDRQGLILTVSWSAVTDRWQQGSLILAVRTFMPPWKPQRLRFLSGARHQSNNAPPICTKSRIRWSNEPRSLWLQNQKIKESLWKTRGWLISQGRSFDAVSKFWFVDPSRYSVSTRQWLSPWRKRRSWASTIFITFRELPAASYVDHPCYSKS